MTKVARNVYLEPEQQAYLQQNPDLNFSGWVRKKLEERMAE